MHTIARSPIAGVFPVLFGAHCKIRTYAFSPYQGDALPTWPNEQFCGKSLERAFSASIAAQQIIGLPAMIISRTVRYLKAMLSLGSRYEHGLALF